MPIRLPLAETDPPGRHARRPRHDRDASVADGDRFCGRPMPRYALVHRILQERVPATNLGLDPVAIGELHADGRSHIEPPWNPRITEEARQSDPVVHTRALSRFWDGPEPSRHGAH